MTEREELLRRLERVKALRAAGDVILVKASRSLRAERVVSGLSGAQAATGSLHP